MLSILIMILIRNDSVFLMSTQNKNQKKLIKSIKFGLDDVKNGKTYNINTLWSKLTKYKTKCIK